MALETHQPKLLLVDDAKSNIDVLVGVLQADYKLSIALNGEAALKIALGSKPDLILLDIMMPGMNGYEVCRRLRANPVTREIPVLFLTALDDVKDKVAGFEAGGSDYVTKPFQHLEVRARVNALIQAKAYRDLASSYNEALEQQVAERRRAEAVQRVAREAAESANQMKSQFLATMSHELRTPLNAIIGYSELLHEEAKDLNQTGYLADLGKISYSAKHLLSLIDDILDFSKIEAGKVEMLLEDFSPAALVRDVTSIIQPLAEKNNNVFTVDCPATLGAMHADVRRLRQSLLNLLSNACKFTRQGTVSLVAARETADGRDWLSFSVRDTGIGITPDQQTRLFRMFNQAETTTSRQFGGTGLGLAISRALCQMMGGDITVQSELGKGSVFTIRIPATVIEPADPATVASPAVAATPDGAQGLGLLLAVDDDPAVHEQLARFFTREGFRVAGALNGRHGLRLARELSPAAITLDAALPQMEGWSVLTALKQNPDLVAIPVFLLAMAAKGGLGWALRVDDCLTKPIQRPSLARLLARFRPAGTSCRALVVEADSAERDLLLRMVLKEGWEADDAEDPAAALRQYEEHEPDLILLDPSLPGMDGFELIERIRSRVGGEHPPLALILPSESSPADHLQWTGSLERALQGFGLDGESLLREVHRLVLDQAIRRPAGSPTA